MGNQDMNSLLTGLTNGINQYLGVNLQNKMEQAKAQQKSQLDTQKDMSVAAYKSGLDLNKDQALELYKQSLAGKIDPQTASSLSPKHASLVENFNKANGRYPTVPEADKLFDDIGKGDEKQQKSDDVRMTQYARLLSSDREFTTSRTKRDNLENVGALIQQVSSQADGPDKRQMYEQAVAQMRVLAGNGQISEKEISELVPHTWRGTAAKYLEYIANKPEGTEAQDFIKRSQDFFDRESKATTDQMSRRVNELSAPYKQILERNPDVATETFQTYKVNHPKYNPATQEAPKKATTSTDPKGRPSLDSIFGGK